MSEVRTVIPKQNREDCPEIQIPYQSMKDTYASQLADMMDRLHKSEAHEAKKHDLSEFRFYLIYIAAPDPITRNEEEFIKEMESNTKVQLRMRGFKYTTSIQLDFVPQNVMNRIQQRAKLICQVRKVPEVKVEELLVDSFDKELKTVLKTIDLFTFNMRLDAGLAKLAKQALMLYKKEKV